MSSDANFFTNHVQIFIFCYKIVTRRLVLLQMNTIVTVCIRISLVAETSKLVSIIDKSQNWEYEMKIFFFFFLTLNFFIDHFAPASLNFCDDRGVPLPWVFINLGVNGSDDVVRGLFSRQIV